MSVSNIKLTLITVLQKAVEVLGHQRTLYRFLGVLFSIIFVVAITVLTPSLGLHTAAQKCLVVYGVLMGFTMSLMQINRWLGEQLIDLAKSLQSEVSELINYLQQQFSFWRQLYSAFLLTPHLEISFFGCLQPFVVLTERPRFAPLAFRS